MAHNSIVFTEKVVWSFRLLTKGYHRSGHLSDISTAIGNAEQDQGIHPVADNGYEAIEIIFSKLDDEGGLRDISGNGRP
jgi:hypothetical protein